MQHVEVRAATHQDADLLFTMQRASALAGFAHIFPSEKYPFPDDAERIRWAELLDDPRALILVAEQEARPVGLAVVSHDELMRFFVVPEWWGTGIADVLHDAVLQTVREQGHAICRLWVLEENHRARRFYERRGWRLDERRRLSPFPPFPPAVGYSLNLSLDT